MESLVALSILSIVMVPLVVELIELGRTRDREIERLQLEGALAAVRRSLRFRHVGGHWQVQAPDGVSWASANEASPWYPSEEPEFRWRLRWQQAEEVDAVVIEMEGVHGVVRGVVPLVRS